MNCGGGAEWGMRWFKEASTHGYRLPKQPWTRGDEAGVKDSRGISSCLVRFRFAQVTNMSDDEKCVYKHKFSRTHSSPGLT